MPRIDWQESFSVNNYTIDTQHKQWLEILNELHETLMGSDSETLATITNDSLESMQEYAKKHFTYEEEYLKEINYPYLAEHKSIHNAFLDQVVRYKEEVQEGKYLSNTKLMKVLRSWLLDHILNEDKKYSLYASIEK